MHALASYSNTVACNGSRYCRTLSSLAVSGGGASTGTAPSSAAASGLPDYARACAYCSLFALCSNAIEAYSSCTTASGLQEDLIDGIVTIAEMTDEGDFSGKVFKFKNPKLEKSIMVRCVILYGTKYRPRDNAMWTDDEFADVIRVDQGKGFRVETLRDEKGFFLEETVTRQWNPEEWVVELDNGASFLNMKQGRDFPRPSAAILSLAWLGQAYEAEFW